MTLQNLTCGENGLHKQEHLRLSWLFCHVMPVRTSRWNETHSEVKFVPVSSKQPLGLVEPLCTLYHRKQEQPFKASKVIITSLARCLKNLRIDIEQRVSLSINCISVSLLNSDQVIVFSLTNSSRNVIWHLLVI